MKKAVAEVDSRQQLTELGELVERLVEQVAAMTVRIEKLDPTPKREKLEPWPVDSNVYSVSDLEGRYPLVVRGYDRHGRVLVTFLPGEPERSLPIESVRPIEECSRAQPSPDQAFANVKCPKARAFMVGRRNAQIEAATRPSAPFIPEQVRYGRTGTFTGGRAVYDE
jgi:hypothetical protein